MPPRPPPYRPDIEGLRGIAILLVVGFHAGVSWLAGGFVGVDVFFVLSGFFITTILARELIDHGEIDAGAFYAKRALRLLPPLLVTLAATLLAVWWLYAPIDRAAIAADARAVALYAGNVSFARDAVDYFSTGDNPLLHTWSLAVEEQFYFIWPMLFLVVGLLGAAAADLDSAGQKDRLRRRLLIAIVITGGLSLVAALWLTRTSQPWAFFGMPARIWEFALGGALALPLNGKTDQRTEAATLLQAAGLAAIGFAVVTYDRATPYPGFAALFPALGAGLLLIGGDRAPASAISRALGASWLRWLGRLSYAWYLWHWPLVGVAAVLDWQIGVWGRLAWSAGALGLAWLTHRFIERPIRDGATPLSRVPAQWVLPGAIVASVLMALAAHGVMIAAERRAAMPDQRAFAAARVDRMEHDCWAATIDDVKQLCEFGDTRSATVIALLGDSHAEHWLGALDRAGRERGWRIVAMVKGGCPVAEMPELMQPRLKRYYHECTRYREAMVQRIVAMRPAAALLSSWDHYMPVDGKGSHWQVTPEIWQRGLRRTYERLSAAGIPVVAMRGTPRTWFDVPACLSRRAAGLWRAHACTYERAAALSPLAVKAQNEAARGLGVAFIDMNDQICATPRCAVSRNGTVIFTDDNHLTASFSRSLAPVLGSRFAAAIDRLTTGR